MSTYICDQSLYREMVGALFFLSARTRPDIAIAGGILSRRVPKPTLEDMLSAKRVFRYLRGTTNFGLKLGLNSTGFLVYYADTDWAGDKLDRKSTSGYILLLGNYPVHWRTGKKRLLHYQLMKPNSYRPAMLAKMYSGLDVYWKI